MCLRFGSSRCRDVTVFVSVCVCVCVYGAHVRGYVWDYMHVTCAWGTCEVCIWRVCASWTCTAGSGDWGSLLLAEECW